MLPLFLICVSFHGGVEQGSKRATPSALCAAHGTYQYSYLIVYSQDKTKIAQRHGSESADIEPSRMRGNGLNLTVYVSERVEKASHCGKWGESFGKWLHGDLAEESVTHCLSGLHLETKRA